MQKRQKLSKTFRKVFYIWGSELMPFNPVKHVNYQRADCLTIEAISQKICPYLCTPGNHISSLLANLNFLVSTPASGEEWHRSECKIHYKHNQHLFSERIQLILSVWETSILRYQSRRWLVPEPPNFWINSIFFCKLKAPQSLRNSLRLTHNVIQIVNRAPGPVCCICKTRAFQVKKLDELLVKQLANSSSFFDNVP